MTSYVVWRSVDIDSMQVEYIGHCEAHGPKQAIIKVAAVAPPHGRVDDGRPDPSAVTYHAVPIRNWTTIEITSKAVVVTAINEYSLFDDLAEASPATEQRGVLHD